MAVPVLTAISPASGLPAGGTVVNITGTNLASATGVKFAAVSATLFASLSATEVVAVAPAGTGAVDVTVVTAGGTSGVVPAGRFTYASGLFTVAEARAFGKGELASAADYPDAAIIAAELEIRTYLERATGVNFIPTTHTDEMHSGDSSYALLLDWPLPTSILAVSLRSDTTWTALTAPEIAQIQMSGTGVIYRDGAVWPAGFANVKLTYVAGHAIVPPEIARAARRMVIARLPVSNTPFQADSYEAGGTSYSWQRGDGYMGSWDSDPVVMAAIRMYDLKTPGIA
jgi:hypothetical protein